MDRPVYINRIATLFPNSPVSNEEIEDYIGLIGGNTSRVLSILLRQKWDKEPILWI